MASVAELGQKVKAKFPGSYDDLDDVELGRRVKSKFPGSYDDFADVPSGPPLGQNVPGAAGMKYSMLGGDPSKPEQAPSSFSNFLSTVGSDIVGAPKAIAGMVMHPIDTMRSLAPNAPGPQEPMAFSEMAGHAASIGLLGSLPKGVKAGSHAATLLEQAKNNPALKTALIDLVPVYGGKINKIRAALEPPAPTPAMAGNAPPTPPVGRTSFPEPATAKQQPAMGYKVQGPPTPVRPAEVPPQRAMAYDVGAPPAPARQAPPKPEPAMGYQVPGPPAPIRTQEPPPTTMAPPPLGRFRPGAEPEPTNTVTSPETAAPSTPVDRSGINNLVHGVAQRLGIDHDMLSGIARTRYKVKTMQDMSHDQMVDLYGTLLKGNAQPVGKPLPLKSTGKPSEATLEDQLMRSIEQSKARAKKTAGPAEEPPTDITAYAKGGIIHKKHYLVDAKSGKVDGVMAEAGPERISPITKGPSDSAIRSGVDVIRGTSNIGLSRQGLREANELGTAFAKKGFGRGR